MFFKKIHWNAYSNDDRYTAIHETVLVINKYGTIANFLRFSDLSLGLSIEIEENLVEKLYTELKRRITIAENLQDINSLSEKNCLILLNLTFIRGTGDLEIENPGLIE
jgi:hypothetical protein